jgi:hypothetical protein
VRGFEPPTAGTQTRDAEGHEIRTEYEGSGINDGSLVGVKRGGDVTSAVHGEMAIQNVRSLPMAPLAEALALAHRIVRAAPDPSHVRELALDLVRLLEARQAARPDTAELG